MAKILTDLQIKKLAVGATAAVPQCRHLYVRRKAKAANCWVAKQARGKLVWSMWATTRP